MTCVFTFQNGDVVTGRPALKAYLTANLATLLPARAAKVPAFKRSPVQAATSPDVQAAIQRVEQVVADQTMGWASSLRVIVAADMNDPRIPAAVREDEARQQAEAKARGEVLGQSRGFWHDGNIYLLAAHLPTDMDAARVLFHEGLGHLGLRGVFGEGLNSVLQQVVALRKADVVAKVKEYRLPKNMTEARDAALKDDATLTGDKLEQAATTKLEEAYLHAAEEVLATMAETTPQIGFVKRAIAAILSWLRKNVPGFASMKLSDAEIIRSFILPARAFVEQGAEAGQAMANKSDIRHNRAPAPATTAPTGLTPEEQGKFRKTQAEFQDDNNRIHEIQKRIQEITGQPIPEYADYYMAETNRPGRIAARLQDFREKMQAPLVERIAKSGHTLKQVAELAHAMHAPERNRAVAKINPKHDPSSKEFIGVEGSGMNSDVAADIMAKYKDDKTIQKHVDDLRKIARAKLDIQLASGRITQEQYDAYVNAYDFYVPLKGDGEYGPEVKRAMGHEEREENILENVMRDYEQAVVASERNLARQAALQLVLENPDNKLWTVGVTPMGRYVAGQVFFVMKDGQEVATFTSQSQVDAFMEAKGPQAASYEVLDEKGERVKEFAKPLQDNELPVYIKGQRVRIQFKDEKLAQQMRPLDQKQMNVILETFRSVQRFLSRIYTAYSPTFLITNPLRDAGTGTVSMLGNQGAMITAKAWANYPSAMKAMVQYATSGKEPDSETGRMLKEYRMNGGKTGASHMSDLEEQGKTLQRLFDDAYGAKNYMADGKPGKAALIAGRKALLGMAHVVEVMNQATENGLRLALFMTLRQAGESPARAAQAAKNVTVNFDRKGHSTGVMSALYLFFNPAVQGTANALRTIVKGKHKEQAWVALGVMAMAGMWAVGAGLDDDEDRWLGQNWDTRSKKLIFKVGGTTITLPMSLEFAPFYAFGVALEEARRGKATPAEAASRIISSVIDAYVPFKGLYSADSDNHPLDAATAIIPTVLRPGVEAATNRNSFGSKIVPENEFTKDRPDNLKMNRATKGTVFDTAAQAMAAGGEMLGEGRYENGLTKVSPEMLKHWYRTYTGGLGSFIGDSASLAKILAENPKSAELSDVPVVKSFAKEDSVAPIRGRFYDLSKEARAASEEFKQAKKAGDGEAMDKLLDRPEKAELLGLDKMIKRTTSAAAQIRDEMVDVNQDKDLDLGQKRAKLKALEREEEAIYRDAIEAFR